MTHTSENCSGHLLIFLLQACGLSVVANDLVLGNFHYGSNLAGYRGSYMDYIHRSSHSKHQHQTLKLSFIYSNLLVTYLVKLIRNSGALNCMAFL